MRDLDELIESAELQWQSVLPSPESDDSWGLYCYSDGPPAIGGGVGGFVWFKTRDDMLTFIKTVLPYSPPGPETVDPRKVASDIVVIVDSWASQQMDNPTALASLNQALKRFSQIEWAGTFSALCEGAEEFALGVREGLITEKSGDAEESVVSKDGDSIGAIRSDLIPQFKQYLEEYGL